MTKHTEFSGGRRRVLQGAVAIGAGLTIGFYLPARSARAQMPPGPPLNMDPNTFLHIRPDNTVLILSKHTEMGQGVYTGLATALAEELDADWHLLQVEAAPANAQLYKHPFFGMQGTGGSSSIPTAFMQMRNVGARARAMLVAAAATRLGVDATALTTRDSIITHAASGRSLTYGDVSAAAAMLPVPQEVALKDASQFRLIGQRLPRLDAGDKSTGRARFTMDVYKPGMVYAVVAHSPVFGGKVKSFDDSKARAIKGVVDVVQIPRGVAVLAEGMYAARSGRDALVIEWDNSGADLRGSEEIIADYIKLCERPGGTLENEGDCAAALAAAARTFEATYIFPYLAHAPMEPLDTVIEMVDGKVHITSGTQMPSVEQERVAKFFGLKTEDVTVTVLYAGGGFGRRGNFVPDMELEAASILKASGGKRPIKLVYTREDDTTAGFYRPLYVHKMRGAVDAAGNISGWENRLVGQSFVIGSEFDGLLGVKGTDFIANEGATELPYEIPNVSVDAHVLSGGIPVLAWRSVGHTHTAYSKETFLDEMLEAAGHDPVKWRLAHMKNPREKAVLELAAEKAGWGTPLPAGRARGVAYVTSFGTLVAQIVEVSLNADGTPKVERVVCAVDCGLALNPDLVNAQMEGAVGFGLSAALYGEVKVEQGAAVTRNFDTYRVVRMNEMPRVEVHIVPSDAPPSGMGEPGVPPIAPAVANAYARLTGKRYYRLPLVG